MLTAEEAKKRLQEFQIDPDGEEHHGTPQQTLDRIAKLPKELRAMAYGLVDRDEQGNEIQHENWQAARERRSSIGRSVEALTSAQRVTLLSPLLGNLAEHAATAWDYLRQHPFQTYASRRAFHVPGDTPASLDFRSEWLIELIGLAPGIKPEILTPAWLAAWCPHLGNYWNHGCAARLLAAVIDAGGPVGDEVFDILCQSARNEHEIGAMGRHVVRALLSSSRQEGWELMERMLLAAQRQEGLRQVILETVDEAHPQAFRRMLRLILDQGLERFSSVVRAVEVWIGLQLESQTPKTVRDTIAQALEFLDGKPARDKALAGSDPQAVFLALWAAAIDDAVATIPLAEKLLSHKKSELRYVAVVHLCQVDLPECAKPCLRALDDEDLRVALAALQALPGRIPRDLDALLATLGELFESVERLYARMPEKPQVLPAIVWPWTERKTDRENVARYLAEFLGDRPPTRLIPYLDGMSKYARASVVESLSKQKKWDKLTRDTLVELAGSATANVREAAMKALAAAALEPHEVRKIEGLLTRKASDVRLGALDILLKQSDDGALESADQLLISDDGQQRLGGLELLRRLLNTDRSRAACIARAKSFQETRRKLSKDESAQLEALLTAPVEQLTLDNALGLMNPADLTPVVPPEKIKFDFVTPATIALLKSLDDLIHEHREKKFTYTNWDKTEGEALLGEDRHFPVPYSMTERYRNETLEDKRARMPFLDIWESWRVSQMKDQRDVDDFELNRAEQLMAYASHWRWDRFTSWSEKSAERTELFVKLTGGKRIELRYPETVKLVVRWLLEFHPPEGLSDFLLDAAEANLALIPISCHQTLVDLRARPELDVYQPYDEQDWRRLSE